MSRPIGAGSVKAGMSVVEYLTLGLQAGILAALLAGAFFLKP